MCPEGKYEFHEAGGGVSIGKVDGSMKRATTRRLGCASTVSESSGVKRRTKGSHHRLARLKQRRESMLGRVRESTSQPSIEPELLHEVLVGFP